MKRIKTERQIRSKTNIPFILIGRSNKNYYLSIYQINKDKYFCKGSMHSYYKKGMEKQETIKNLASSFFNKYKEEIKNKKYVVRIKNRVINSNFFGKELLKELKKTGLYIIEGFDE